MIEKKNTRSIVSFHKIVNFVLCAMYSSLYISKYISKCISTVFLFLSEFEGVKMRRGLGGKV